MIRKILGLALAVVAFVAGAGAGDYLSNAGEPEPAAGEHAAAGAADGDDPAPAEGGHAEKDEATAGPHGDAGKTDKAHGAPKAATADGGHGGGDAGHGGKAAAASHGEKTAGGSHGGSNGGTSAGGSHGGKATSSGNTTWFQFPQQFFVPVMRNGRLESTMVLSLSLEVPSSAAETVYAHELKLRDAMLRQLLIHANTGGFDGNFTAEPQLRALRADLAKSAQATIPEVGAVLIGDIARQEAR